jgi:glycosyltransferase involved in cell wall biosynthesis
MEKITSIQIIGTQRSGSNLLRLILNQYDEISAPHPPHVLKTFAQFLKHYGNLQEPANFQMLAQDISDFVNANPVPWNNKLIDAGDLVNRARNNSLLGLYETLYKIKAEEDKASIWCCKSMFNEYYAREIEAEGIRPFYIYLYRDGRDVAASFKRAIIGPKHTYFLAKSWVQDQERALQVKEDVENSRFCMIKYEDLIHYPEEVLKSLSLKLGLEYSKKLLEYHKSTESKVTASSGELWRNVARPIIKNNQGKYRTEISRDELEVYETVAGSYLERLGYQLDNEVDTSRKFSDTEVEEFTRLNAQLQEEAKQRASDQERDLRKKQEELIARIRQRFAISV